MHSRSFMSHWKAARDEDTKILHSVHSTLFIFQDSSKKKGNFELEQFRFACVWISSPIAPAIISMVISEIFERCGVHKLIHPQLYFPRTLGTHGSCGVYPPVMTSLPCITALGSVFVNSQQLMSTRKIFTQLLCRGITPVMPFQEDHTAFPRFVLQKPKKLWHFRACNTSLQITTF